ncbi:MAG: matrixin family metalloprotease [Myxococcaceae bacterium]|nr:matrixin family metalloprotease [Myxococcaceae bacterium]
MRNFLGVLVTAVLMGNTAFAFELAKDSTGTVVRWRTSQVRFNVSTRTFKNLDQAAVLKAAQAAASTMAQVMPGVAVNIAQGNADSVGYAFDSNNNQNDIVMLTEWSFKTTAIATTVLTIDKNSHAVIDADIALNAASKAFAILADNSVPGGTMHDLQNTLTHEIGHALGLAHNPEAEEAVMYPTAPAGEVSKRKLADDDIEALVSLYAQADNATDMPAQGCSSTGNSTPTAFAALFLMMFSLRHKTRRLAAVRARQSGATGLAVTLALAVAGVATPAAANEAQVLSDPQMMATVEVVSQKTLAPETGSKLLTTQLVLKVRWCAKGNCPQQFSVTVPGGTWGNIEQRVEGLEVPAVGAVVGLEVPKPSQAKAQWAQIYRLESETDLKAFVSTLTRFK